MPRQSPAAKAYKLFTELLADFEAAFMRFAEAFLAHNGAARSAVSIILGDLALEVDERPRVAWEHAKAKMAAWFYPGEVPVTGGPAAAASETESDNDLDGWDDASWMEFMSDTDSETEVAAFNGGLIAVHQGEAAF